MSKPPPQRQISSRPGLNEQRPKKRPARPYSDEEDDDGGEAISLIRKMFGYRFLFFDLSCLEIKVKFIGEKACDMIPWLDGCFCFIYGNPNLLIINSYSIFIL